MRVLRPLVTREILANPTQVKAIACARIETDSTRACCLGCMQAGFSPDYADPVAGKQQVRCAAILSTFAWAQCPGAQTGGTHQRHRALATIRL